MEKNPDKASHCIECQKCGKCMQFTSCFLLYFSFDCYNDDHVRFVRADMIKNMIHSSLHIQEAPKPEDPNDIVEEVEGFLKKTDDTSRGKRQRRSRQRSNSHLREVDKRLALQ